MLQRKICEDLLPNCSLISVMMSQTGVIQHCGTLFKSLLTVSFKRHKWLFELKKKKKHCKNKSPEIGSRGMRITCSPQQNFQTCFCSFRDPSSQLSVQVETPSGNEKSLLEVLFLPHPCKPCSPRNAGSGKHNLE